MFIVVNKNFSLANITPSTVYQGSNLANELAIFAPFSISSYSAVEIAVMLPSGEYLEPSLAFPTAEQPDGFGAWSMLLPASVTAIPGTVRLSLSFIGANNAKMVTEAAEFTVNASVPSVLPETPSQGIYKQILGYVSEVLNRKPNWNQTNVNSPDYIINKPPISKTSTGVEVTGTLSVDGVAFSDKLDKVSNPSANPPVVYAAQNNSQTTIEVQIMPTAGAIAQYDFYGNLATNSPNTDSDAINRRYLNQNVITIVEYTGSTGVLSFKKADGTVITSVDLPLEMTVSGARYDETSGALVLTFTNGDVVDIPLAELLLPEWITNLDDVPDGSENIPPTSKAVIEYSAPVIKGAFNGYGLFIDDFSETSDIAVFGNNVFGVYGRNLINLNEAQAINSSLRVSNFNLVWTDISSGDDARVIEIPVTIPKDTTFSFSLEWIAEANADKFSRARFYNGLTLVGSASAGQTSGTFKFNSAVTKIYLYKAEASTPIEGSITISKLTLNIGDTAEYTPYQASKQITPTNGTAIVKTDGYDDGITLISTGAALSVKYNRDSTKVINKLFEMIAEIQDAIAT